MGVPRGHVPRGHVVARGCCSARRRFRAVRAKHHDMADTAESSRRCGVMQKTWGVWREERNARGSGNGPQALKRIEQSEGVGV